MYSPIRRFLVIATIAGAGIAAPRTVPAAHLADIVGPGPLISTHVVRLADIVGPGPLAIVGPGPLDIVGPGPLDGAATTV